MVGPMVNFTIIAQSSMQVDSVKADSEFLDPSGEILCQILSLNFNSHNFFQIFWPATYLGQWHNIAS
jgi:hypothetical protein